MQISEPAAACGGGQVGDGGGTATDEQCRFPKLEECAHFHYERVQLPKLTIRLQSNIDQSLHSQHSNDEEDYYMLQVTSGDECWLLQRNLENFQMLDDQLHQCIYDRKISQLDQIPSILTTNLDTHLITYLTRLTEIADNSLNCGPILNWLQMDNRGHRLLVPSEDTRSINTPAVAAAYSIRRYVSQARDELSLEVGDMISVIDMAAPGESMWWRGKRGFQVGFFPQYCVHIIGDKVPRNMPLPPPVVGTLALGPIKPVLRRQHGKLITFFRSFLLNRPSRRRLKERGILRERVFGCDLGEHLLNSAHDLPMVLKCCAEFIEKRGIVDGIYRLSGVTSNIQRLRNAFDEDRIPNLYTEDILQDIHSVASLLKMYFRELPNPLCTYQLYQSFVAAVQGANSANRTNETDHSRLLKMREAVQKLPPPHYRTLEYLMRHLATVAHHGSSTGMTTRNIAIVWAPNLLRCAELEVGGVAALQGVGVQAVVTEFLICYSHLIFCDHLPNLDLPTKLNDASPKRPNRPKSLAISTPTKLITLEEARNKHLLSKNDECNYIEVGGGPKNLPKKYHTIIELPGARKRGLKRSPLGWRSLFSKSRNNSQGNLSADGALLQYQRKASTPNAITENSVTDANLLEVRRKLRSVKSAESLTSGHSEPTSSELDIFAPLYTLSKQSSSVGHNRSISHDSYFDSLPQSPPPHSDTSLLDLSEIQLNFELEESEMRIFSEDESLVCSPRPNPLRRLLNRDDATCFTNSANPSPKKQARVVLLSSPDLGSRKRTRLEDQFSDIQFIDCTTPENLTTMVQVHHENEPQKKSPRNSDGFNDQLHTESNQTKSPRSTPRFNDQLHTQAKSPRNVDNFDKLPDLNTPTPQSPDYHPLNSNSSTPPPDYFDGNKNYENITTTISIIYKSPPTSTNSSPVKRNFDSNYENVVVNEKALIPTSTASLPAQEARLAVKNEEQRPRSLNALDSDDCNTLKDRNYSLNAICDTSESIDTTLGAFPATLSINSSFGNEGEISESEPDEDLCYEVVTNECSLSEVLHVSSSDNLSDSSFPSKAGSEKSLIVSPMFDSREELTSKNDLIEFSPDDDVYEQVRFFRRSIHEVNSMVTSEQTVDEPIYDSLEPKGETKASKVRDLANKFETSRTEAPSGGGEANKYVVKKYYEKDTLPPCLRAKNLRNQIKTRSLDEEEFGERFGLGERGRRRASMDEGCSYKCSSLPKQLNQPKVLPNGGEESKLTQMIHLAHSSENVGGVDDVDEEVRKRERIEKYKEERRKFLHDKYRSESFKEDKDVLLSQLKIFKSKDETTKPNVDEPNLNLPPRRRTSGCRSDDQPESPTLPPPTSRPPLDKESVRSKTAIFEQQQQKATNLNNQRSFDASKSNGSTSSSSNNNNSRFGKLTTDRETKKVQDLCVDEGVCLRRGSSKKDDLNQIAYEPKRRQTYECERMKPNVDVRVSLDSKPIRVQEKTSPSYCIKDMKAIFESKSKQ